MKCLEKDRTRRYETANGLATDVERYLNDEPVEACPPSAGYRLRKFVRRNKAAACRHGGGNRGTRAGDGRQRLAGDPSDALEAWRRTGWSPCETSRRESQGPTTARPGHEGREGSQGTGGHRPGGQQLPPERPVGPGWPQQGARPRPEAAHAAGPGGPDRSRGSSTSSRWSRPPSGKPSGRPTSL